jgi:hypothetical protein
MTIQMGNSFCKPKEGFSQINFNFHFKIISFTLKNSMRNFLNCNNHITCTNINVFISWVFISNFVSICSSFLNEDLKWIKTIYQFVASTNMARWFNYFSLTIALLTVLLELLDKTRCNLLLLYCKTLAITVWTCVNILWIISSWTPTVRTDNFPVICNFDFFSYI